MAGSDEQWEGGWATIKRQAQTAEDLNAKRALMREEFAGRLNEAMQEKQFEYGLKQNYVNANPKLFGIDPGGSGTTTPSSGQQVDSNPGAPSTPATVLGPQGYGSTGASSPQGQDISQAVNQIGLTGRTVDPWSANVTMQYGQTPMGKIMGGVYQKKLENNLPLTTEQREMQAQNSRNELTKIQKPDWMDFQGTQKDANQQRLVQNLALQYPNQDAGSTYLDSLIRSGDIDPEMKQNILSLAYGGNTGSSPIAKQSYGNRTYANAPQSQQQRIRVRNKSTGQTGTIMQNDFSPDRYDRL